MSQQKVLVLVGDAAEELDAMYPIYRLREAGYIADVAALTRRIAYREARNRAKGALRNLAELRRAARQARNV